MKRIEIDPAWLNIAAVFSAMFAALFVSYAYDELFPSLLFIGVNIFFIVARLLLLQQENDAWSILDIKRISEVRDRRDKAMFYGYVCNFLILALCIYVIVAEAL